MKIKVRIDQAACLAKGLDAPNSYHFIEVNPASLTPEQRLCLSGLLKNGIEADLAFNVPTPNFGDLQNSLTTIVSADLGLQIEKKQAEANLVLQLGESQVALLKRNLLPKEQVTQACLNILKPWVEKVKACIPKPTGYELAAISVKLDTNYSILGSAAWEVRLSYFVAKDQEKAKTDFLNLFHKQSFPTEFYPTDDSWVQTIEGIEKLGGSNLDGSSTSVTLIKKWINTVQATKQWPGGYQEWPLIYRKIHLPELNANAEVLLAFQAEKIV